MFPDWRCSSSLRLLSSLACFLRRRKPSSSSSGSSSISRSFSSSCSWIFLSSMESTVPLPEACRVFSIRAGSWWQQRSRSESFPHIACSMSSEPKSGRSGKSPPACSKTESFCASGTIDCRRPFDRMRKSSSCPFSISRARKSNCCPAARRAWLPSSASFICARRSWISSSLS